MAVVNDCYMSVTKKGVEDRIHELLDELVDTVEEQEGDVDPSVLGGEPYPVHESLEWPRNAWEDGRKSLRTVPVVETYEHYIQEELSQDVTRSLLSLDIYVDALDEIIDTQQLGTAEKIDLTANVAYAGVHAFTALENSNGAAVDELTHYFTDLFQIPLVEKRLCEAMYSAESEEDVLNAAIKSYGYRSRVMDAFAKLPAMAYDLDEEEYERIRDDLRNSRARSLIYKDIHDVDWDLENNDITPVIVLMERYDDAETVSDYVDRMHESFSYSPESKGQYREVLSETESAPENQESLIREKMDVVSEHNQNIND